ncbi:MAG: hypothetical protein V2A53_02620 [bacterium]
MKYGLFTPISKEEHIMCREAIAGMDELIDSSNSEEMFEDALSHWGKTFEKIGADDTACRDWAWEVWKERWRSPSVEKEVDYKSKLREFLGKVTCETALAIGHHKSYDLALKCISELCKEIDDSYFN